MGAPGTRPRSQIELEAPADVAHLQRLASLGTIASIIAHEFNNILTPILSYAQMALEHPEDQPLQKLALRRAAEGAERAASVSAAILDFARSGPVGSETPSARVDEAVDSVLLCLCRDMQKDQIRFETAFHVKHPTVAIRPIALQQVLLNLILNARAAFLGPGNLTIRTCVFERGSIPKDATIGLAPSLEAPAIRIDVEDNGPGIDAAVLQNIWSGYVSITGGRNRRGTGLGLIVCRKLIEQAGGGIWVQSTPGKGATFSIVLANAH